MLDKLRGAFHGAGPFASMSEWMTRPRLPWVGLFGLGFLVVVATFYLLVLGAAPALSDRKRVFDNRNVVVGDYRPIENLSDPHVIMMAEWAVSEYNEQQQRQKNENNQKNHHKLLFQKVTRGESQVVAGMNYKLVVRVDGGDAVRYYETVVYEGLFGRTRQLTSFLQVKNPFSVWWW